MPVPAAFSHSGTVLTKVEFIFCDQDLSFSCTKRIEGSDLHCHLAGQFQVMNAPFQIIACSAQIAQILCGQNLIVGVG